ncbi:hypothetical protein SAMN04489835_1899 [Mycolicibacterium rutilum]|uniref:Uncharacterized protein n=1 Tax=Mycolicibacterium rutilum TaxID=370526 RepID=A0A1H6JLQ6_MYCRU|nr:hypothetical protein [Mycolicibacterium rutilum]SEH60189.1 hypothetical protein SAMN04489835_1899 [Mycolicibacterium rutilum]
MFTVELLMSLYLCGWAIVSLGLYFAGRRFAVTGAAAEHPVLLSLAGGMVWPLVVIGVIEMSSVVVYTKVQNKPGPGVGILA